MAPSIDRHPKREIPGFQVNRFFAGDDKPAVVADAVGHPHHVAATAYAALQNVAYIKFLPDLFDIHRFAFIGKNGVAGDYQQIAEAG